METTTLLLIVAVSAVLFLVRRFVKGPQFTEAVNCQGKVVVVTGANSGIGLETTRHLNLAGARVYMLGRDDAKTIDAKVEMVVYGCEAPDLVHENCDLTNFQSIRECAARIVRDEQKVDILINNAGVMYYPKYEKTVDGHELTWQSNHLGHFLLTELLMPALKKSPSARIINVSSELHRMSGPIDLSTVDDERSFGTFPPYNRSKLANVMHSRELTRRLREEGCGHVVVNSLHPGTVNSSLARNMILYKTPLRQLLAPFLWFFLKSSRDGAQTSLFVALSRTIEGVSGKYFMDCKMASESKDALDDAACKQLYDYSLRAVGLDK